MQRLQDFQRKYLIRLTDGEYGADYVADRRRIGGVHERIGLDPAWYLGTYAFYLDLLAPAIIEQHTDDPAAAVRASTALSKLMILDMQIVLDAYYGIRERHAVERSEQLAAVGELAASIAHEVRNPLAGMKGALQVLLKELAVTPDHREITAELLAQIDRLENLVRDLLTYAQPRALRRQSFELHPMVERLQRLFQEELDRRGITVLLEFGPNSGELTADPTQMEQVFLNLMHNAMQAMENGGQLSIGVRAREGAIEVSLRDTGKGIAPGDLERIFQPFFTTRHRGSGPGAADRGRDRQGPRRNDPGHQRTGRGHHGDGHAAGPGEDTMSERVLIVDDEKLIRWAVRSRLQEDGFEIAEAPDGATTRSTCSRRVSST